MAEVKLITAPKVQLVSTQTFHMPEGFGDWEPSEQVDDGVLSFQKTTGVNDADAIPEFAGRLCYLSFGKGEIDGHKTINGRPNNSDYLKNILTVKHGSVLEHSVTGFLFEGVSRSLTHELVRHRAGFGFSQLSQRYVDESSVAFVVPPELIGREDSLAYLHWLNGMSAAQSVYSTLLDELMEHLKDAPLKQTEKLKKARQTARSVLPNATETKIVVTGNARAWRHFIDQRANEHADVEIRRLAVETLKQLQKLSPNIFGDYVIEVRPEDGTEIAKTENVKV